jgi:hypothetical protein
LSARFAAGFGLVSNCGQALFLQTDLSGAPSRYWTVRFVLRDWFLLSRLRDNQDSELNRRILSKKRKRPSEAGGFAFCRI